MAEYVLGFAFAKESDTLLMILKDHPEWQAGRLNGIGGAINPGESPIVAMIREFGEETGLHLTNGYWKSFAVLQGRNYRVYCFWAEIPWLYLGKARSITPEKIIFCSMHSLTVRNAVPNVTWLLPMARAHGKDVSPTKPLWLRIEEQYERS